MVSKEPLVLSSSILFPKALSLSPTPCPREPLLIGGANTTLLGAIL